MATLVIIISSLFIVFWTLRASRYRLNGIISADIFVSSFFVVYVSLPLAFFSAFSFYPQSIALEYYAYSFICLCLFVVPWQLFYRRKSLFLLSSSSSLSKPLPSHFRTNWFAYLLILAISSVSHLAVNPAEYGLVHGGSFAIALFLVRLLRPLLIVSLFQWMQGASKSHLISLVYIVMITLPFVVVSGRRSDIFFLPIAFAVVAVTSGKLRIPRFSIILFILLAAFLFNLLPLIRDSSSEAQLKKYGSYTWVDALYNKATLSSSDSEAAYAAIQFRISSDSGLLDWFAPFFNQFSTQFVSSTIFGEDVKSFFMLPVHSFDDRCAMSQFCSSYSISNFWWMAPSGFLEVYQMISYAGVFIYLITGYLVFQISVASENAQITCSQPSPYVAASVSLSPLVVYASVSYYLMVMTVFYLVIRLVMLKRVVR